MDDAERAGWQRGNDNLRHHLRLRTDRVATLEAALRRIADLDDSRSDEAAGIARRALER